MSSDKNERTERRNIQPRSIPGKVEGRYLVRLKDGVRAQGLVRALGVVTDEVYDSVLDGFAATMTEKQVEALRRNPNVTSIEPDGWVRAERLFPWPTLNTQELDENGEPWGLDRIDQISTRYTGTYRYLRTGKGVTAYVLDTGIDHAHHEFQGRARPGYDQYGTGGRDVDGHGTHCAGTIGGKTFGAAKEVDLVSVKVLDDNGWGTWSGVIAGMDWVAKQAARPAIANLSLGGGFSAIVNSAVDRLTKAGVSVIVAAGNESQNACNTSPASAPSAVTVGASTRFDHVAGFSNFGPCVTLYAPGTLILSALPGGGKDLWSGTSMAAPLVAGIVALLLEKEPHFTPRRVCHWLVDHAHRGRLKGVPRETLLVHKARL